MTNNHSPTQYLAHGDNPGKDAPTRRPIRNVLSSLRRAHADVAYLNQQLFDRPW
jgi:hypothetical protein